MQTLPFRTVWSLHCTGMCTQYTTLQSQLHRFASEYFYLQPSRWVSERLARGVVGLRKAHAGLSRDVSVGTLVTLDRELLLAVRREVVWDCGL